MIDLLYVSHNRLEFTRATFAALIANTNWDLVRRLQVLDDESVDGTWDALERQVAGLYTQAAIEVDCVRARFGGPVAAMNRALDNLATETLVKIDNDVLVCPGWLDALLEVLAAHPRIDVLGFEAGFGDGLADSAAARTVIEARHVGGIGAFRARAFAHSRPNGHGERGMFGWTDWQRHNARCGWLTPDLPCPLLDHLPFDPWRSLAAEYVRRGWSRAWPAYPESMEPYWSWWAPVPT